MKIKLRYMTPRQWNRWLIENCVYTECAKCPFKSVNCSQSANPSSWINHKDTCKNKFLEQEIEIKEKKL